MSSVLVPLPTIAPPIVTTDGPIAVYLQETIKTRAFVEHIPHAMRVTFMITPGRLPAKQQQPNCLAYSTAALDCTISGAFSRLVFYKSVTLLLRSFRLATLDFTCHLTSGVFSRLDPSFSSLSSERGVANQIDLPYTLRVGGASYTSHNKSY